jgi:hypothetical protein
MVGFHAFVDLPVRRGASAQEQSEGDTGGEEAGGRCPAGHDAAELDGVELVRLTRAVLERPAGGAVEDETVRLAVPLGPLGDDVGDDAAPPCARRA